MSFIRALVFSLALFPALANAQGGMMPGPGTPASSGASYQGPGDVVASATAWGSCARAYNAAYANGTNPLCDLKDKTTGTVAVCTLRVLTTGFADLAGTYCAGSTTPSAACAAAAGGSCLISKVYDQTGNGNDFVQATPSTMPAIVFAAVNSLPAINCGTTGTTLLVATAATFSTTNFSQSAVYIRTTGTALGGAFGSVSTGGLGSGSGANLAAINNGSAVTEAATDNAWHGLNATFSSTAASDALNVDGLDNTGLSAGTAGMSSAALRFCRSIGAQLLGRITEGGFWSSTSFNATQRGNLYTNMHGTNGYNGAF
jgi:hypothetical protein